MMDRPSPWLSRHLPEAAEPIRVAEDELDAREMFLILRRRFFLILGSIVIITGAVLAYMLNQTPLYTSEAKLMVDTRPMRSVGAEQVIPSLPLDFAAIETEAEVLRSRRLAEMLVDRLDLMRDPEFNSSLSEGGFDLSSAVRGVLRGDWLKPLLGSEEAPQPSRGERAEEEVRERVLQAFLGRLKVRNDGRSYLLTVSFTSHDPWKAAEIANAVVDAYIGRQLEAKFEAAQRSAGWLETRLDELREQVRTSEAAVQAYREEHRLTTSGNTTITGQQLSDLNAQITVARAERAQAEARLRRIQDLLASPGGVESAAEVLASPIILRLRESETELQQQAAEMMTNLGERHPDMITIRARAQEIRRHIEEEAEKVVQALHSEVAIARAREQSLVTSLEELRREAAQLDSAAVRLNELERDAEANRTLFQLFLNRFKETTGQDGLTLPDVHVVSAAAAPMSPSSPSLQLPVAAAFVFSALLGLFLAMQRERMDEGVRTPEQIERLTGVPHLAEVPDVASPFFFRTSPEDYVIRKPGSRLADSIHSLRTLLFLAQGGSEALKSVLVTSAVAGEGKSVLAVAFAHAAAMSGRRVLLIDCDLRNPRIHAMVRVTAGGDLVEVLADRALPHEVVSADARSGLHVIGAEHAIGHPADLLRARMPMLMRRMAQEYDLIVLDSPPVTAGPDALVLSRLTDATLYVLRWGRTPAPTAIAGIRQLMAAGANVSGVVLSRVNRRKQAKYYGYGRRHHGYKI